MRINYKKLGDIIILQGMTQDIAKEHAPQLLETFQWAKSVYYLKEIRWDTRTPVMIHLAGEVKEKIIHHELGTKFVIPIKETMFSPGNHHERLQLIKNIPRNSHVVDMFCAVGNLSMALAVNRKDVTVTGIEFHEPTFFALQETIKLNHVEDRFIAIHGDNRVVTPHNVADVVFMGFFGWDDNQFRVAINSLKNGKGRMYLHYNEHGTKAPQETKENVKRLLNEKGLKGELLQSYVVKKSGPRKIHYVQVLQVE